MIRVLSIGAAAGMMAVLAPLSAAAQAVDFQLYLSWTEPRISDKPTDIVQTIYLTLNKDGSVKERVRQNGLRRRKYYQAQEGALGADLDGQRAARWKVVNEGTLVRLIAERTHTFAVWLTTDGKGSCAVKMEWRLKPGFKTYERWDLREQGTVMFGQPVPGYSSCRAY